VKGDVVDIGSAVTQGLIGMQRSQTEMTRSAQQIVAVGMGAQGGGSLDYVPVALVNIKVQASLFDASAKIIKSADETLGTLLRTSA